LTGTQRKSGGFLTRLPFFGLTSRVARVVALATVLDEPLLPNVPRLVVSVGVVLSDAVDVAPVAPVAPVVPAGVALVVPPVVAVAVVPVGVVLVVDVVAVVPVVPVAVVVVVLVGVVLVVGVVSVVLVGVVLVVGVVAVVPVGFVSVPVSPVSVGWVGLVWPIGLSAWPAAIELAYSPDANTRPRAARPSRRDFQGARRAFIRRSRATRGRRQGSRIRRGRDRGA
jgi:hypothetical protein